MHVQGVSRRRQLGLPLSLPPLKSLASVAKRRLPGTLTQNIEGRVRMSDASTLTRSEALSEAAAVSALWGVPRRSLGRLGGLDDGGLSWLRGLAQRLRWMAQRLRRPRSVSKTTVTRQACARMRSHGITCARMRQDGMCQDAAADFLAIHSASEDTRLRVPHSPRHTPQHTRSSVCRAE
jgi:hypothetical protein